MRISAIKSFPNLSAFGFFVVLSTLVLSSCSKKSKGPSPTVKFSMRSDPKTLDPAFVEDFYSGKAVGPVYEGLVEYEYLKRPHELKPLLADSMPKVSSDGLTFTFKIKKGVKFHDHPAFPEGKGREVTAEDFVYSWKRVADPKANSGMFWVFDGHIVGLNKWRDQQRKKDETDFSLDVEGFKAVDQHTLQIKTVRKYPQLLYVLAMPVAAVVAREVVENLGQDFGNVAVGTGPYKFISWMRGTKLVFEKNEGYRKEFYPNEGEPSDSAEGLLADAGKALPLNDRYEIHVHTESQPRWLSFLNGDLNTVEVPKDNYDSAIDRETRTLKEEYVNKGITLRSAPELDVTYIAFNMEDPFIKKAGPKFRQALSLAIDQDRTIDIFYNGRGVPAHSPVPPGIAGYDKDFVNPYAGYDVEKAKKLLAEAGFPGGKGVPVIEYEIPESSTSRQMAEKLIKEFSEIGVTLKVNVNRFAELIEKINKKKAQMWGIAWLGDYPDAENFLQLLYGPNKSPSPNGANYDNPQYNALFKKMRGMPDSPERRQYITQMKEIFVKDLPWIVGAHRTEVHLIQPWTANFKPGYMGMSEAKFLRVDSSKDNAAMAR